LRATARFHHQDLPVGTTVAAVQATEGLSRLFDIRVELLSDTDELDLRALLWSKAALTWEPHHAPTTRYFHGVIEEATYLDSHQARHRYELRLRPALNGLGYRIRSRIFQEKTVVEVIDQVLTDAGVPTDTWRWETTLTFEAREYCVQWKESELAFVLRLLEEEGIFYWFEHTDVDHVLCFGDGPSVHEPIEDPFLPVRRSPPDDHEALWGCRFSRHLTHDRYISRDWNFETPEDVMGGSNGEEGLRTRYEYPGIYKNQGAADVFSQIRLEEAWAYATRVEVGANVSRIVPGSKIELLDVQPEALAQEYLVTAIEHRYETHERDQGGGRDWGYWHQSVSGIPSGVSFRPPRVTPRPIASGFEVAVVTGPAGEEIHVDDMGRIKVHFYWDRENPVDDTASCWIRFQQLNTQGALILPRLGWEVHVAFENGDPDRPVAFHKAYNQETMPPYGLPANKTQSSLQSSTSPGGGSVNEIRMQDGSGGMEFFAHASKDFETSVTNDENETVGVDATESVGNTYTSAVGVDETGTIGGNQSISISDASDMQTTGSRSVTVGGNDDWGVKANFGFATTGDRTESIGGLMNVLANKVAETFNAGHTRNVGAVQAIISATAINESVGGSKTETVSAAKAVITPAEYQEQIGGVKTLNSGAATFKTSGDVGYTAKGAVAVTAAGVISIKASGDAMFTGSQVRVTCGSATFKGGGGEFKLGGSLTIDAKKFGGDSGPMLKIAGTIDYKD